MLKFHMTFTRASTQYHKCFRLWAYVYTWQLAYYFLKYWGSFFHSGWGSSPRKMKTQQTTWDFYGSWEFSLFVSVHLSWANNIRNWHENREGQFSIRKMMMAWPVCPSHTTPSFFCIELELHSYRAWYWAWDFCVLDGSWKNFIFWMFWCEAYHLTQHPTPFLNIAQHHCQMW